MKDARVKPGMVIYTCIIQACANAGQLTRGMQADSASFSVLIGSCVRDSEWNSAIGLVRRAMDSNIKLHSKTYRLLSTGLQRAQQHLLNRELEELQIQWPADDRARENVHRS